MNRNNWFIKINQSIEKNTWIRSITLLGVRLYLTPIFLISGIKKVNYFNETVTWFGDILSIPFPFWATLLLIFIEFFGGLLLLLGLTTRWISFSLVIILLVAIYKVHWENGWYMIGQETTAEISNRIQKINQLIQKNGNFDYLTELGEVVIFSNGMEFITVYSLLLLILFSCGSGKLSLDYLITKK